MVFLCSFPRVYHEIMRLTKIHEINEKSTSTRSHETNNLLVAYYIYFYFRILLMILFDSLFLPQLVAPDDTAASMLEAFAALYARRLLAFGLFGGRAVSAPPNFDGQDLKGIQGNK